MAEIISIMRDCANAGTFRPAVTFTRDSEDFVLGYEAGMLHARLDARPESWSGTYHRSNVAMLRRVADACGYEMTTEPSGDALWVFADFTPTGCDDDGAIVKKWRT